MLLSLLKKFSGSSESTKAAPVTPQKEVQTEEKTHPVNLPCWKDKSTWSTTALTPEDIASCNEIKETIIGITIIMQMS